MNEEIKKCPLGEDTHHKPYVVNPPRELEEAIFSNKAYVVCSCGCRGPERYGDNSVEDAIKAWNTRYFGVLDKAPVEEKRTLEDKLADFLRQPILGCGEPARIQAEYLSYIARNHFKEEGYVKIDEVLRVFDGAMNALVYPTKPPMLCLTAEEVNLIKYIRQSIESMRKEP